MDKNTILTYAISVLLIIAAFLVGYNMNLKNELNGANGGNEGPTGDAELVIEEWSEFACPFCGRFATQTHDQILEEYPEVEFEFKHFIVHPQSAQKPAEGYECAKDQVKEDEYYMAVFRNQGAIGVEDLKQRAEEIGLDVDKFSDCIDSGEKAQIVQDDTSEGRAKGVSGTPTFFIKGTTQSIVGAQPIEAFRDFIDEALE